MIKRDAESQEITIYCQQQNCINHWTQIKVVHLWALSSSNDVEFFYKPTTFHRMPPIKFDLKTFFVKHIIIIIFHTVF